MRCWFRLEWTYPISIPHDVFLVYPPIHPLETALILLKLLTVQVRKRLRQPQVEPHVASKLQITCNTHSHPRTWFPRRSGRRITSQHSKTLQTSSNPTISEEQLLALNPPQTLSDRTSCHFILPILANLSLLITLPLPPCRSVLWLCGTSCDMLWETFYARCDMYTWCTGRASWLNWLARSTEGWHNMSHDVPHSRWYP